MCWVHKYSAVVGRISEIFKLPPGLAIHLAKAKDDQINPKLLKQELHVLATNPIWVICAYLISNANDIAMAILNVTLPSTRILLLGVTAPSFSVTIINWWCHIFKFFNSLFKSFVYIRWRIAVGLNSIYLISELCEVLVLSNQRKNDSRIFCISNQTYAVISLKTLIEYLLQRVFDNFKIISNSWMVDIDKEYNVFISMFEWIHHAIQTLTILTVFSKYLFHLQYTLTTHSHIINFSSTLNIWTIINNVP